MSLRMIKALRSKWQLSLSRVILVILVFGLAGTTVVRLRPLIMNSILPPNAPFFVKISLYILFIFPLYQILLMFYGVLLGQFSFFWKKEKKMISFFYHLLPFSKKRDKRDI